MRLRPAFAVGALALVVALTGCGVRTVSGTPTADSQIFGNAQELVRAATAQTEKSKSAKFTIQSALGAQAITGQGEGRFDGDDTAMHLTMTVGSIDEDLLYVDKTMYIQLPEQYRAQMTSGKPWGKLAADSDLAKTMGAAQAQQNDPSQILQQIQEGGTITRSEQTMLDGLQVTHYWIDVDVAKSIDKLKAAGLPEAQLNEVATKVKTIPVELWLDGDLLPVQFTEDMSGLLTAAGAPASMQNMKVTMKYTDWGTPVDVQAPPADQVGELKLPN
jgi:hypothetical protein